MKVRVVEVPENLNEIEYIYCELNRVEEISSAKPIAFIEDEDRIFGSCTMLAAEKQSLLLDYLEIISQKRSMGIGTQLFRGIKKWAKEKKFTTIDLLCSNDNFAKYLYFREGMNIIYKNKNEDMMAMTQYLRPNVRRMAALLDLATEKIDGKKVKTVRQGLSKIGSEKDWVDLLEYGETEAITNSHNENANFKEDLKKQYTKFVVQCNKLLKDKDGLLYTCADIIDEVKSNDVDIKDIGNLRYFKKTIVKNNTYDQYPKIMSQKPNHLNTCDKVLGNYRAIRYDRESYSKEK